MLDYVLGRGPNQDTGSRAGQSRRPSAGHARALIAAAAMCMGLVGCTSSSDVVSTGEPGSYSVAASATGGRLAWARAHQQAMNQARDYCERRGMLSSVKAETVSGVQTLTAHGSSVNFECHPKF